jgi:hypothetical protein
MINYLYSDFHLESWNVSRTSGYLWESGSLFCQFPRFSSLHNLFQNSTSWSWPGTLHRYPRDVIFNSFFITESSICIISFHSKLVILYGWNMILASLNILAQAFLSHLSNLVGSKSPPQCLSWIYNSSFMTVLGLGHLVASKPLNPSPPTVAVVRNFYKRNNTRSTTEDPESSARPSPDENRTEIPAAWGLFAASVNRISFVAYTTITLVLLACLIWIKIFCSQNNVRVRFHCK